MEVRGASLWIAGIAYNGLVNVPLRMATIFAYSFPTGNTNALMISTGGVEADFTGCYTLMSAEMALGSLVPNDPPGCRLDDLLVRQLAPAEFDCDDWNVKHADSSDLDGFRVDVRILFQDLR